MGLNVKIVTDIDKIDVINPIQKSLLQSSVIIQGQARKNAPIERGTLRRSILTDLRQIRKGVAIVYSDLAYARRREFENRKNPRKKFYMRNAANDKASQVEKIFLKNLEDV